MKARCTVLPVYLFACFLTFATPLLAQTSADILTGPPDVLYTKVQLSASIDPSWSFPLVPVRALPNTWDAPN
ncbi:MAG: hypothetical protein WCE52_03680, partial [Candidatus Acidiferrum sp.]